MNEFQKLKPRMHQKSMFEEPQDEPVNSTDFYKADNIAIIFLVVIKASILF